MKSILTGKGRKQWIAYFEKLDNEQLLKAYNKYCEEKKWDQARAAKLEMNERKIKPNVGT